MVDWMYCKNCGTVVDEFETVCSYCKGQNMLNKEPEQKLTTFQNIILCTLLLMSGIGVATTVYAIVEYIALR